MSVFHKSEPGSVVSSYSLDYERMRDFFVEGSLRSNQEQSQCAASSRFLRRVYHIRHILEFLVC